MLNKDIKLCRISPYELSARKDTRVFKTIQAIAIVLDCPLELVAKDDIAEGVVDFSVSYLNLN